MKTSNTGGICPCVIGVLTIVYLWVTPNLGYLAGNTYSPMMAALAIPGFVLFFLLAGLLGGLYSTWHLLKDIKRTSFLATIPYVVSILCALGSVPLLHRVREQYVDAKLRGFGDRILARVDIGQIRSWMDQVALAENRKARFNTSSKDVPEFIRQVHPYSITVREDLFPPEGNAPGRFADFKWPGVWEAWGLQICSRDSDSPWISKTARTLRLRTGVYVYIEI